MRLVVRHRAPILAAALATAIAFPLGAIASHQFSDVPDSNAYHNDIDALADSGVTSGCGGGNFCPSAFVTREQMAAFMNRLGALSAGKTPVVNADKVDGRDASDLIYVIDNKQLELVNIPQQPAWDVFEQVTINAPTAGFVLVTGSVTIFKVGCTANCVAFGAIELSTTALASTVAQQAVEPAARWDGMSMTRVIPVAAGSHTFQIRLSRADTTNGSMYQDEGQISAIFSPFGDSNS